MTHTTTLSLEQKACEPIDDALVYAGRVVQSRDAMEQLPA
jgi:hypothetical protein